jgi:hypothetical protein
MLMAKKQATVGVRNQPVKMLKSIFRLMVLEPLMSPTPSTEPITAYVVDIGTPTIAFT